MYILRFQEFLLVNILFESEYNELSNNENYIASITIKNEVTNSNNKHNNINLLSQNHITVILISSTETICKNKNGHCFYILYFVTKMETSHVMKWIKWKIANCYLYFHPYIFIIFF